MKNIIEMTIIIWKLDEINNSKEIKKIKWF